MNTETLLLEIGCEELPSSTLRNLGEGLHEVVLAELATRELSHGASRWYATPRRLAVLVENLIEATPDKQQESLGPPLAQAKDANGQWTKAAEGFAKRCGVAADDLQIIESPKGPRLGHRQLVAGVATADCIAEIVDTALKALPIAKRMRWGVGRREFARPVHWILLMLGARSGLGQVMGMDSGARSFGHRFHAPQPITLEHADQYESALKQVRVIADFSQRRKAIREQATAAAAKLGARAVLDENLLDEVASLVEWPVALAGRFDEAFLSVPAEALVSSMQTHQKYFPVVSDDETAKLLPYFITISNIDSRDPQTIITGNERVIRPRLADAAFFFEQDRKHRLDSQLQRLDDVVFQKQLGSLGDRARRIEKLAGRIAPRVGADETLARRAGLLAKADLVSEMVQEFGDMQGIAGGHYARHDGERDEVANAIVEHYWPLGSGSELPRGAEARAVALADRLDTLVGIFGIGEKPSGSKDPFALRRAAISVLRILIEEEIALDLREALEWSMAGYEPGLLADGTVGEVLNYALDRLPALYVEGTPVEVFRAVRASGVTEPLDLARRIEAVQAFLGRSEAEALAAANKRVANILNKADDNDMSSEVTIKLLKEPAEKLLMQSLEKASNDTAKALADGNYRAALGHLAALRDPVDAFFDDVMVNADDPEIRANRLSLLRRLRREFLAIADISQLAR